MHNNYATTIILFVYLFCLKHFTFSILLLVKIRIIIRNITNSLMKLHKLCKNILNNARKIKFYNFFFHILISHTILQLPSKNEVNTLVR